MQFSVPFSFQVSWLYFMAWSICQLLSVFGLVWVATVSAFFFVISKYTDGLQEIEIVLEKRGLVKGLFALIFRGKKEE